MNWVCSYRINLKNITHEKQYILAISLLSTIAYGQVGVNTDTPAATLDIVGKPTETATMASHTEIETVDLWVNERWYRATYYPVIDNNNTTAASDDIRKIAISVKRLR